jgi:S-adenosylhomocysteine hydrolase
MSRIKDIALAPEGDKKITWARANMPLLREMAGGTQERLIPRKAIARAARTRFACCPPQAEELGNGD